MNAGWVDTVCTQIFVFFGGCEVGLFQFNFSLFLIDFKTTVMTLA